MWQQNWEENLSYVWSALNSAKYQCIDSKFNICLTDLLLFLIHPAKSSLFFFTILRSLKMSTSSCTFQINWDLSFFCIFSCPEQLNRWQCHWLTQGTFTFDIYRVTLETCDLWDIWSEWWGDMTWLKIFRFSENVQIFGEFSDFWRIFRFLENFQIFGEFSDFRRIFRISENFQIFGEFSDFRRISRFFENFQIFWEFSVFWRIFRFLAVQNSSIGDLVTEWVSDLLILTHKGRP